MKYWSFLFTIFLTITANATTKKSGIDNDCVALFYKDGISAGFPLLKKGKAGSGTRKNILSILGLQKQDSIKKENL